MFPLTAVLFNPFSSLKAYLWFMKYDKNKHFHFSTYLKINSNCLRKLYITKPRTLGLNDQENLNQET